MTPILLLSCQSGDEQSAAATDKDESPTPYVTSVLEYMPAPGQYTNLLPLYEEGDTQESMSEKVLERIGGAEGSMISLGGYGGYVVVGFDHTIENREGLCDFRVKGNAYYSDQSDGSPSGGSCEPGIVMVAYDANQNGVPDDDEWYEIAGSSHIDPSQEGWYEIAQQSGGSVAFIENYSITYIRAAEEPSVEEFSTYIAWSDSEEQSGYIAKNSYNTQCYFPQWVEGEQLSFSGSRLPDNGVDTSGEGSYYVLYKFLYGYADNATNSSDDSAIDIGWAVDAQGESVELEGVDFVKVYTGVNQSNGMLGECSTEITGVEDLHLLGVEIATR